MIAEQIRRSVTLADLEQIDDEGLTIEVDDGEIITEDSGMTILHLLIMRLLFNTLNPFAIEHKLGEVFMNGVRYRLIGTKDNIVRARQPDLSFVRADRIPADLDLDDDLPLAPDLAVEVASPGQSPARLLKKAAQYLDAGTQEVWILYPRTKRLYRYQQDHDEPQIYGAGDALDGPPLFPGLTISIDALFGVKLG
jgi:Uma2 family endonuclease